ncbi:MAG: hypothetical protein WC322_00025 [Candidatus Paceibacterota bacterium]|jgi:hypothetical protein
MSLNSVSNECAAFLATPSAAQCAVLKLMFTPPGNGCFDASIVVPERVGAQMELAYA